MSTVKRTLICAILLFMAAGSASAAPATSKPSDAFRVYEVKRRVSDFPQKDDLSTPEAAYAAINRIMAGGEEGKWREVSTKKNASRLPPADAPEKTVKPEEAAIWLNAQILEVRVFRNEYAAVIASIAPPSGKTRYDYRSVSLEGGQWLNEGEGIYDTLSSARAAFGAHCAALVGPLKRQKVSDPDAYLKTFVDFLAAKAEDPKAFVMKALAAHKLTIMGEIHHRPRYWAFNSSLVSDPEFARHVGTIYMELPSNDQALIDGFLAAEQLDAAPVIEMLRDFFEMGWPDQSMLEFFVTVWEANQALPTGQKLRIVLADMERPWKRIQHRDDWRKYDVDRDQYMADMVLRDLRSHPNEKRNALFIVGAMHTSRDFHYIDGTPVETAGYHLCKELGKEKVYAFMQHTCCSTNMGQVNGRLCLGVFESAFAALKNKPLAFPLSEGPFGQEPFDAFPDRPVSSDYRDGYDAYLYLGPLEDEKFSSIIPGFYSEEFLKEVQRRYVLMNGKGWSEIYRRELTPKNFVAWMQQDWGQPRRKWRAGILGPLDAWKLGSEWKEIVRGQKIRQALDHPEPITKAAEEIFGRIRTAHYDEYLASKSDEFSPLNNYTTMTNWPALAEWICKTFRDNPIQSVKLGQVKAGKGGMPTVPYELTLKDGYRLKGDLPFDYDPMGQNWYGKYGIDWHLKYKSGLPRAGK